MALPINRRFPLTPPLSMERLMSIAVAIESQAAARYDALAERMARRGEADLVETFRSLAELERRHEAGLIAWYGPPQEGDAAPSDWHLPETFSQDEAPLSPYEALSIAVRNEEDAFSFYTYVAAMADALPTVRERAEALAREELSHVAQLRRLRRQAYHRERAGGRRPVQTVRTLVEFKHLAWTVESAAAELCAVTARRLDGAGRPAAAVLLREAAEAATRCVRALAEEGGAREGAPATRMAHRQSAEQDSSAERALYHCEREAKQALDTYLAIAEAAPDEQLLAEAQSLADQAAGRLALIRQGIF